ncbi:uncharacterized protein CLUP02_00326 [Colletotrichum lupini]|uniref:Uncharacterized protein n=1 Tax=Colletotrichum lupini TaxID=145971 RepID=A0A9Q8SA14_9PEZI|nr:uncharacterized protein CLUP02_00326 [Colletotrichum lupini]UQC73681.1 hypothetical protein CLUP02_00326 [Colletotrichum lupini]
MVNSGGETNDGGGFGGRCVFPHKGEAGTARMELEPGGPLPVPSAAGGHCAAEASIAAARWCGRALLGTPSLTVGVARHASFAPPHQGSQSPAHTKLPRSMVRDFSHFCYGYPSPEIMKGHVTWHSRRSIHDLKAPAS